MFSQTCCWEDLLNSEDKDPELAEPVPTQPLPVGGPDGAGKRCSAPERVAGNCFEWLTRLGLCPAWGPMPKAQAPLEDLHLNF